MGNENLVFDHTLPPEISGYGWNESSFTLSMLGREDTSLDTVNAEIPFTVTTASSSIKGTQNNTVQETQQLFTATSSDIHVPSPEELRAILLERLDILFHKAMIAIENENNAATHPDAQLLFDDGDAWEDRTWDTALASLFDSLPWEEPCNEAQGTKKEREMEKLPNGRYLMCIDILQKVDSGELSSAEVATYPESFHQIYKFHQIVGEIKRGNDNYLKATVVHWMMAIFVRLGATLEDVADMNKEAVAYAKQVSPEDLLYPDAQLLLQNLVTETNQQKTILPPPRASPDWN